MQQEGVKQVQELGQNQILGKESLLIVAPHGTFTLRHITHRKRGSHCISQPVQCASKVTHPRLLSATEDFTTNIRDRTAVGAKRRERSLLIVPTSTRNLMHIAIAVICNELPMFLTAICNREL